MYLCDYNLDGEDQSSCGEAAVTGTCQHRDCWAIVVWTTLVFLGVRTRLQGGLDFVFIPRVPEEPGLKLMLRGVVYDLQDHIGISPRQRLDQGSGCPCQAWGCFRLPPQKSQRWRIRRWAWRGRAGEGRPVVSLQTRASENLSRSLHGRIAIHQRD